MKITITRETPQIFVAVSDSPYWSDGQAISERLALSSIGILSNSAAQSIDRQNGKGYILVSPFGIRNPEIISRSQALAVGESFTFER